MNSPVTELFKNEKVVIAKFRFARITQGQVIVSIRGVKGNGGKYRRIDVD